MPDRVLEMPLINELVKTINLCFLAVEIYDGTGFITEPLQLQLSKSEHCSGVFIQNFVNLKNFKLTVNVLYYFSLYEHSQTPFCYLHLTILSP